MPMRGLIFGSNWAGRSVEVRRRGLVSPVVACTAELIFMPAAVNVIGSKGYDHIGFVHSAIWVECVGRRPRRQSGRRVGDPL